jgi:hypothetical protein
MQRIDADDLCPERRDILRSGASGRQGPKDHIVWADSAELDKPEVVFQGISVHTGCIQAWYLCAARIRQPPWEEPG